MGARLLQSRVLVVRVARWQRQSLRRAITSTTDYSVCGSLRDSALTRMEPPRVSVFINDGPNGSHEFRFRGDGEVRGTASLDGDMLARLLLNARTPLGKAVWGTEQPWCEGNQDRYAKARPPQDVVADLVAMARAGYRIWFALQCLVTAWPHSRRSPWCGLDDSAEPVAGAVVRTLPARTAESS